MSVSRRDVLLGGAALLSAGPAMVRGKPASSGGWRLPDKNAVKVIDNTWIGLKDGTQLSARLWLPEHAGETPCRSSGSTSLTASATCIASHDDLWGQELAQYGIGFARVDARGSGDSQGILVDEYLDQELSDGVEVIAWLARQPWSNGSVGMRGISWGGINTLQIAALAPPGLKAIMPMCCTDTRYTDDAHYIGGALGLTDLQWGVQFKAVMAMPPDPAIVGDAGGSNGVSASMRRRRSWSGGYRTRPTMPTGSAARCPPITGGSRCPVYIVDGWVDTYVNTVTRILAQLSVPRKALIGPWAHNYPESASPGPSLQWSYEEVRWWKHWLAGVDTGIMDEPMLRAYMPYRTSSEIYPADTPGRWVAEQSWPSPHIESRIWFLDEGRLSPRIGARSDVSYTGDRIVGLQKPEWLPFPPEGMPGEQTPDDRKSLVFDTAPLGSDLEILGHPVARIRVAADQPVAKLALRLCEVTPEGKSWLVTYGLLNLTHREGDEKPAALNPGEPYDVVARAFLDRSSLQGGQPYSTGGVGELMAAGVALTAGRDADFGVTASRASSCRCARRPTTRPFRSLRILPARSRRRDALRSRRPDRMLKAGMRSARSRNPSPTPWPIPALQSAVRSASGSSCASSKATTRAASGKESARADSSAAIGTARSTARSGSPRRRRRSSSRRPCGRARAARLSSSARTRRP